jgi:hypothetical protein
MSTFIEAVTLTQINCGECGGTYAINERFRLHKYENNGGWHCPYCDCQWGYFGQTQNDNLRKQLEERERELRQVKCMELNERNARIAAEMSRDRLRKRVSKGVCPCCKRTVKQMAAHMASKHPTYPKGNL